ncbi:MAG: hypothetical protein U0M33_09585 [Lachnospiraceae bacterium]|nr:hypothetical protein [Lachnospiraceae bacterium]
MALEKRRNADAVRYLNDKNFEKENSRSQLTINDILLTTVAKLGRSCIYNGFPENLETVRKSL